MSALLKPAPTPEQERKRAKWRRDRALNPAAAYARTRAWGLKNPIQLKRIKFANRMKKYGLDVEDWARAFHRQEGKCSGCLVKLLDGWHTAIDHCHLTDKFRGLLCIRCNRSIGVLQESTETLRRLALYLESHR